MADAPTSLPAATPAVAKIDGKTRVQEAQIDLVKSLGVDFKDISTEVIRTAANNPLMGCVVAVVVADLLNRGKLLSDQAKGIIFGMVLVAFGVSVTGELASDLEGVIGTFTGNAPQQANPTDLIRPVASTIVYPSQPTTPTAPGPSNGGANAMGPQLIKALAGGLKALPAE